MSAAHGRSEAALGPLGGRRLGAGGATIPAAHGRSEAALGPLGGRRLGAGEPTMAASPGRHLVVGASVAAAMAGGQAHAATSQRWSVGVDTGSLGVGVVAVRALHARLALALQAGTAVLQHPIAAAGVDYDARLRLQGVGAVLEDFALGTRPLFLGAGLFIDRNRADLAARQPTAIASGGGTLDTLDGRVRFNPIAPYLGVGWDGSRGSRRGWHLRATAGVLYLGSPQVDLHGASASLQAGSAGAQAMLATIEAQRQALRADYARWRWYPLLELALVYRFR